MFDTYITVVGTVLTRPEWRRTTNTNTIVASFRIASNSRRFDKNTEAWVDGPSLRVRVNCWRRLAEGVIRSVIVGDPVVVHGRMFTRDWKNDKDELRTSYELEAITVGHDLSRGRARFERTKPNAVTSAVEDTDAEIRVGGEPTESVDALNATRPDELGEESFDDYGFDDVAAGGLGGSAPVDTEFEASEMLRQAGLDGEATEGEAADGEGEDGGADGDLVGASSGPLGGRGRRRGR